MENLSIPITQQPSQPSAENTTNEPISFPYIHRDISWLSFNYRVLQEAKDDNVPLFERLKFLAIYSSNLDEFFRVRVAQHRKLIRVGKKTKSQLDYRPKDVLKEIHRIINAQQAEFSEISKDLFTELAQHNVFVRRRLDLNEEQKDFVEAYFKDNLLPFVQPVLLVRDKIRVFLNTAALYMAIVLQDKENPDLAHRYAIVKVPSDYLPRFILLPSVSGRNEIILLDDIVRHSVSWLFPGFDVVDTYSIKLTRDAALEIDDEFSGNLLAKIKESLQKRNVGPASRFVYDRTMPEKLLEYLKNIFELEKYDLLPEGRYHNNFDFFKFPDFGLTQLKYKPLPPLSYAPLENAPNFFAAIADNDHLVHYPYHSYESAIRFFEEAAKDPSVTHIKILQYRVAKKSRIMQALINAVKAGKQVSAFIEVKARFDEEANLKWGEKLQDAGVTVYYSMPGIKVHSKLAMIRREEGESKKARFYAYLSTGNFHEDTAKIYSDFGLFTADERITKEMAQVFAYLEGLKSDCHFKHLLVGQFNLRSDLIAKIDREIKFAKSGKKTHIILKMNSLEDREMIEKLYEASQAGVQIKLIVRGICCLVPRVKGFSENIEVVSIVDRFLEHARIFIFGNNGKEEIYLSSADWMVRNLSHRVETTFPIFDEKLKSIIKDCMSFQLSDNVKARFVNGEYDNYYRENEEELAIRSQIETYFYFKQLAQK